MKLLKKFRIINWHYIWDETIDFDQIVFLTGQTGAGKSTIVDAMQVVLLGDNRGFNKAAAEKSARTLKGYVRGLLGDDSEDGFTYLRNGRFSSYLAAEFHDDYNDEDFTLGVVFDAFEDGSVEQTFFCLDAAIPTNNFVGPNKVPYSYKDLHAFFKESYLGKFKFFSTTKEYQRFLQMKFGGLKSKYFTLFKKALSFSPIMNITQFITEFVCDEQSNINIEKMQENITQYKRLEKEALNMQIKIGYLEDIEKAYKAYEATITNEQLYGYVIRRAEYENEYIQLSRFKDQIERAKARIRDIEASLAINKTASRDLNQKRTQFIESRAKSGSYNITGDIRRQKEVSEARLLAIQNEIETVKTNLNQYLVSYSGTAKAILETLENTNLDTMDGAETEDLRELQRVALVTIENCAKIEKALREEPEALNSFLFKTWREALNKFKTAVSAVNVSIGKNRVNVERRLSVLRQQESSLQGGTKMHDSSFVLLRRDLQNILTMQNNRDIAVDFFADLIDIRDEKWVNAIEGYFNTQRYSLFVESRLYFKAFEALKEIQRKYGFYGAILVDQEKVIEQGFKASPGSLAEEIETKHSGARAYTNFLIGKLMKCNTPQEARQSGNGITPQCDLYRAYYLSQINPRAYAQRLIGTKVVARDVLAKQKEITELSAVLETYRKLHDVVTEASNLEIINSNEIESSVAQLSHIGEIKGLKDSIQYFDNELSATSSDEEKVYNRQLDLIEEDIAKIDRDNAEMNVELGNIDTLVKAIEEEKIPDSNRKLKEYKEVLDQYDPFFVDEVAVPFYQNLLDEGKTTNEIIQQYSTMYSTIQYRSNSTFNEVAALRRKYTTEYHLSHDTTDRSNKVFAEELTNLRDVLLPEYKTKIHDAYEKAIAEFKDDFLDKIRSAIDDVEEQIENLNIAIKEPTFGRDKYSFSVKPSHAYIEYYNMIKDDILLQPGGTEEFLTKYNDTIENLFKQISSIGNTNEGVVQQNIETFTDYRTYLDFDIIVVDHQGKKQRLSKTIGTKSGGETQTPFYIAVLASFVQLYRIQSNAKGDETSNTSRLIVFDEAFSKMDTTRIKESVRLLRSLDLQVVISAPDDKIADISGLVDETLVVIRGDQRTLVKLFKEDRPE